MHISSDGSIIEACKTQDDAIVKQQGNCFTCNLTGYVTIFHKRYSGLPTMTIMDHNGNPKEVRALMVVHCNCEVGKWARTFTSSDVLRRVPSFHDVLSGKLRNWTSIDPSIPETRDGREPNWKALRRWLSKRHGSIGIKVYPQAIGNRKQARREMGIVDEERHENAFA